MARAFEHGVLYKPIAGQAYTYSSNMIKNQLPSVTQSTYNSSSPYAGIDQIKWNLHFKPIAFIESTKMVVGEVVADESKSFSVMSPNSSGGYGISFSENQITEKSSKIFRVEIEVNEFIRNFEKVL